MVTSRLAEFTPYLDTGLARRIINRSALLFQKGNIYQKKGNQHQTKGYQSPGISIKNIKFFLIHKLLLIYSTTQNSNKKETSFEASLNVGSMYPPRLINDKDILTQNSKNVKSRMAESGGHDPHSHEANDSFIKRSPNHWDSLSSHGVIIPKSVKFISVHLLLLPIILSTFYILPIFASPAYADHPVGMAGEYCEKATNARFQNLTDGTHRPIPNGKCADSEDCVEDVDDRLSGSFPGSELITYCEPKGAGAGPVPTGIFGPPPAGLTQIENMFARVISLVVGLGFVALFVVLVIAGIKFLTSGGEPKAIESARNAVTWALLGILFMAIAWLVLKLIAAFTGIPGLTSFNIKILCPGCP